MRMDKSSFMKRKNRISPSEVQSIIVRGVNWVGDAVMTLPALDALGKAFPHSNITVLAKPWVVPVYASHPSVSSIIEYHKSFTFLKGIKDIFKTGNSIKKSGFDMAFLFQNAIEAALLSFMGRCRIRAGYDTDGRGFLLTHPVHRTKNILKEHQTEYYLNIIRELGFEAESKHPVIHLSRESIAKAESLLSIKDGPFIGFSPGAIYGEAKCWPVERFAKLGRMVLESGAKVILFGSRSEKQICSAVNSFMDNRAIDLSGCTDLGTAMALIKDCSVFVSNDSGLMHVSAALGIPTVAIFGSTNTKTTSPKGAKVNVISKNVDCAPCLKKKCPTDFRCMTNIEPEDVWSAVKLFAEEFINNNTK